MSNTSPTKNQQTKTITRSEWLALLELEDTRCKTPPPNSKRVTELAEMASLSTDQMGRILLQLKREGKWNKVTCRRIAYWFPVNKSP